MGMCVCVMRACKWATGTATQAPIRYKQMGSLFLFQVRARE